MRKLTAPGKNGALALRILLVLGCALPAGLSAQTEGGSLSALPGWLQTLLIAAGVLLIYAVLVAVFSGLRRASGEEVVFRKEAPSEESPYPPNEPDQPKTPAPSPWPPAPQNKQPQPPTETLPKPAGKKKNAAWGNIIFIIIILSILKECLKGN